MKKLISILLVFATAPAMAAEEGFVSLFNGKDLSGWSGDTTLWSVEDGAITGKTNGPDHLPYNKFLIWDGTASDFELRCEFRLEGDNNSGVQYRSRHDKQRGDWVVVGYQADIHANPPYLGMLYDEKGRGIIAKRGEKVVVASDGKKEATKLDVPVEAVDLTQWHELIIIAKGNQLTHKLDGVTTIEAIDNQESERELDGVIAFQVHRGQAMKAQFRNIRLKKFAAAEAKPKQAKKAKKATPPADKAEPQWVWLQKDGQPQKQVFFRKEFETKGVAAARLYAACDDRMTIFVDGKKIVEHGGWEKPVFIDLTKHIDLEAPNQKHVLAVQAEKGSSAAGLLVRIDLESGWRDAWSVVTGQTWQAAIKPAKGWKEVGFTQKWSAPEVIAPLGKGPWGKKINATTLAAAAPLKEPTATPLEAMKIAKDFNVELLYSVPKDIEGSWVNLCSDPKGRLIVSDQHGGLFRVTPPPIGSSGDVKIEKVNVDIGEAQGLLWAFDSLYVVVNRTGKYESGVYRVFDKDGDDQLDTLTTLRTFAGSSGEHGPHAVLLAPDGKSLFIVCGDKTAPTEVTSSRVPQIYDEDLLLPRPYGRGFMKGTRAPGGVIYRINPEGTEWELVASGFRNEFDAAVNADGELFTYDADMEWQEEQIDLAKSLRHLRVGWTPELRQQYFAWFTRAAGYRGGASFSLFVDNIKQDAVALLNDDQRLALKTILEAKPETDAPQPAAPRPFVRHWKMEELVPLVQGKLQGRNFDHGRQLFGAANCFACHRFDNQGGAVGPDLTALSGRFSPRDILESVVQPSKVISDQYAAVTILTLDGKVVTGRIVNLAGDAFRVSENMLDPGNLTSVDRKQIEEILPSKLSMMPEGLLDTLNEVEVLDLMAYLLSRGDRKHGMFEASGE